MANIVIRALEAAGKGIEIGAEDALHFVTGAETVVESAGPTVVSALGVLLGAVAKTLADVGAAAASPVNIALDVTVVTDLKAAWPELVAFASTLGIKL